MSGREKAFEVGDIIEDEHGRTAKVLEIRTIAGVEGFWVRDNHGALWFLQPSWTRNWHIYKGDKTKPKAKSNRKQPH